MGTFQYSFRLLSLGLSLGLVACSSSGEKDVPSSSGGATERGPGGGSGGTSETSAGGSSGGEGGVTGAPGGAGAAATSADWPTVSEILGEPGWRNSSEPLCVPLANLRGGSVEVALDDEGVIVRHGVNCDPPTLDVICNFATYALRNHGEGWEDVYGPDEVNYFFDVQVVAGDDLLVRSDSCAALPLREGTVGECELAQASEDLAFFSPERAFSLEGERIWWRSEEGWRVWAELPGPAHALMVTARLLVAVGTSSVMVQEGTGAFQALPPVPTEGEYVDVWAYSEDDVWLSDSEGVVFHFDGTSWSVFDFARSNSRARFFEVDGELYFLTQSILGSVREGEPQVLLELDAEDDREVRTFEDAVGRSPSEIFVAVRVSASTGCGEVGVFLFDGNELHHL